MIDEILPRKNVFIRPPIANLDILFIVTSTTQPVPSTLVLDELAAAAIYKDVQPVLVVTKADLAAADMLRTAYTGQRHPADTAELRNRRRTGRNPRVYPGAFVRFLWQLRRGNPTLLTR